MINYQSRFKRITFCDDEMRNVAMRMMLFVGHEERAGGEPVFRSSRLNVLKNLRAKRFLGEMRRRNNTARIKRCMAARRAGGPKGGPLQLSMLAIAYRRKAAVKQPKRATVQTREGLWGRK
jgi:hypothetical protein